MSGHMYIKLLKKFIKACKHSSSTMKIKIAISAAFVVALIWACSAPQHSVSSKTQASSGFDPLIDSILQEGLDGEALYTLLGDIKPMSSVISFSFAMDPADREWHQVRRIQQALNQIKLPDLAFVLVPYEATYNGHRNLQVNVMRLSRLDSLLSHQATFFGPFGLVEGASPAVVLTANEYGDRYDRLRGYGYLFGYPDYAVDFFAEAAMRSDSLEKHVERDFFTIPVHSREDGRFVYAIPKGHQTTETDSTLYRRSMMVLQEYRLLRDRYLKPDSTIRAYDLLKDYFR